MNWGGFAGGFAQGFNNGVSIGKTLDGLSKERKLQAIREQGIAEAKGLQESAIADLVKDNGVSGATGAPAPAPAVSPAPAATPAPIEAAEVKVTPVTPQTQIEAVPLGPVGTTTPPASASATPASATPSQTTPATPSQTTPTQITSTGPVAAEPKPAPQPVSMPEIAAQAGVQPAGKRFSVGDRSFDTREEAVAFARKKAPSVMDFMSKTLVPRMQEAYLAQGDVEKAEAWGQWAEQRQSKKAMAEWASAWRAASMGDVEKAADHVFNLYKTYDDGITPLSKEIVKDKDGNITGFNVTLKTEATGEKRTQFIDKSALTELGLAALSPPQIFEAAYKRQMEADKAATANRAEIAKERRAEAREIAKEQRGEARGNRERARDQEYTLEKLTIEEQLRQSGATDKVRREVGAKVDFLRKSGYSEEFINDVMPGIIGIGEYKKRTSPEEARRLAFSDRMKSDPTFGRKSAEDQQRILDQDMKLIMGGVDPQTAPPAAPASPAAAGLPRQAPQPGRGVPIYDTKTGQIVYR